MAMTVLPVTAAAEGNTLTYAISSECETLDPGMCNYLGSSGMIMNLFMGLYRADSTGAALTNGCAESYEVSEDGKTYTFHLYDDVLWSDGTPGNRRRFRVLLEAYAGSGYRVSGCQRSV